MDSNWGKVATSWQIKSCLGDPTGEDRELYVCSDPSIGGEELGRIVKALNLEGDGDDYRFLGHCYHSNGVRTNILMKDIDTKEGSYSVQLSLEDGPGHITANIWRNNYEDKGKA